MLPCTSRITPIPRIGMVKRKVGYTMSRGKGLCRDNRWMLMVTHTEIKKKDGKDHLYGQTMIARMSL